MTSSWRGSYRRAFKSKARLRFMLAIVSASISLSVHAVDRMSPLGLWKTVNDDNQETSLLRITESSGLLSGKVEKILLGEQNATCKECPDDDPRKNRPLLGMTVLKDMKRNGDIFDGGTILAPAKGRIFKAELKVVEGGQKLEMRAKFGPFGRTATWIRVE